MPLLTNPLSERHHASPNPRHLQSPQLSRRHATGYSLSCRDHNFCLGDRTLRREQGVNLTLSLNKAMVQKASGIAIDEGETSSARVCGYLAFVAGCGDTVRKEQADELTV